MLENLSPKSKRCFDIAKNYARQWQEDRLDTWHLMLAILKEQPAWADEVLRGHQLDSARLVSAIETSLHKGTQPSPQRLRVSEAVKEALRHSGQLAGSQPITPQHLFASLLETDQTLSTLVSGLGVPAAQLISEIKGAAAAGEPITPPQAGQRHRSTPTLDRFGRDLTALAQEGKLAPLVGRERELAGMMEILCRQTKRNPILVGEPGVGKTALAEGLAQRIATQQVPPPIRQKRLVELSISALTAGASVMGEFEKRLQAIVQEVKEAGDVVVFIDEVHALVGAGGQSGLQDAATILKPALARGEITCIGATTTHDFRKYVEKDGALARRFQPVRVDEPDRDTTLEILQVLSPRYESHFGVHIAAEVLDQVYELTHRYLKNHYYPDKAIDLLERASARAMLSGGEGASVTVDTLTSVLSDMTGMPLERLGSDEMARYLEMETLLKERVIGQDTAVDALSGLVRLTKRRLDLNPNQPDGVFLFVGPTGVGKTELAKALTDFLFGDEERLIRLDMSEFSEEFTISRLIGAPPGYVGYDQGGQLTEAVHRHPFCVLLLDEIEKAHPVILNLFLQVFDDGRLTDAQGRTVYFSDCTVIMTSNLGGELWFRRPLGFQQEAQRQVVAEESVLAEVRKRLPAEFVSRIDEIVLFYPIDSDTARQIAHLKLDQIVRRRFADDGLLVSFHPSVIDFVVQRGFDPQLGARRLERVIQKEILEPLAAETFRPGWDEASRVAVAIESDQLVIRKEA
ncbi:MAG: ATP-dependent Clp protease ATP-binding subunit [Chloroflexota bacterium]